MNNNKRLAKMYQEDRNAYAREMFEHNADGIGYIDFKNVNPVLHISEKNDKIGNMLNISFPIHFTCDHNALCYKTKKCYGVCGCFCFPANQLNYAENLKFFIVNDVETIVNAICAVIDAHKSYKFFRWYAIGDIYNKKFIDCMELCAKRRPGINFYAYTKKYELVNNWISENGMFAKNLNVMFSLWTDDQGIIYVDNPYKLTFAVFIPYGREKELLTSEMFICPCSNENWIGHCTECRGCPYNKHKIIAFLEHSTKETRDRDRMIKKGRAANKAKKKSA